MTTVEDKRAKPFSALRLALGVAVALSASALSATAQAATITFASGDYDNTANTVTGTNASPIYNNNQTTGNFRDVFFWGNTYNGGSTGVTSPDFINSGMNLISNGGTPARAVVGGDNTALNFTGVKLANGGSSFLTVYDTTPGDNSRSNLFSANGGLEISADVLFAPGQHKAAAGVVALYSGGQDGLALLASNGGGNNADVPSLSLTFQQKGAITPLSSIDLAAGNFLGDTNGAVAIGSNSGDHWYRVVMRVATLGDAWSVNGFFYNHTDATDPNSALSTLIGSLSLSGSLSNPGNALDLTNPGEIGLMAYVPGAFADGVANGWTGADPHVDNVGVSITNFSFPNAVPEPTTWALMILGFGGVGAAIRRRRRAPAA